MPLPPNFSTWSAVGLGPGKVNQESLLPKTTYRIKTVVIDAGHGGHDPGCLGSSSQEKHLALGIAQKLAANLRQTYPGIQVILTRDSDVFIPLYQRASIANRANADLFISIHCNFMPGSSATKGTETYVMGLHTAEYNLQVAKRENAAILLEDDYQANYDYDPNSPEGHIMLSMFQNAFLEQSISFAEKAESYLNSKANRRSRGVKQAGFVVLKATSMPSVLVEAGFLSNSQDEQFLRSADGQQQVADALLLAFTDYKKEMEGGEAPSYANTSPTPSSPNYEPSATKPIVVENKTPVAVQTSLSVSDPGVNRAALPAPPPAPKEAPGTASPVFDFYVQLAAAPQQHNINQGAWIDLPYAVEVVREDNLFKYRARNFAGLDDALQARFVLRQRGFPDAFIVVYRNGKRVTLAEAKKELGIP
ncbi:MAG: N-acetylmuramoyl-L-alanine amidase [Lewinellaceae bacterium]|nr:N-acetylmuramoyl-L-alanine amidase [Lewinellaceae bacterium]